jgi:hypothetical protein
VIVNRDVSGYDSLRKRMCHTSLQGKIGVQVTFSFRSRILLGPMIRFSGYKYQSPDHGKDIHNQIQNLFSSGTNLRSRSKSRS